MSTLFDKIHGCQACAALGNSMGEPVEGWTWQKIEREHGLVDRFLPGDRFDSDKVVPQRFGADWVYRAYHREPGWTQRTTREEAEGLYRACLNELEKARLAVSEMEAMVRA